MDNSIWITIIIWIKKNCTHASYILPKIKVHTSSLRLILENCYPFFPLVLKVSSDFLFSKILSVIIIWLWERSFKKLINKDKSVIYLAYLTTLFHRYSSPSLIAFSSHRLKYYFWINVEVKVLIGGIGVFLH